MQSGNDDKPTPDPASETLIPLLAEEVAVSKRQVETGRVQVARVTHEREQLIDELLTRETLEIERVPVGRHVATMPAVRQEGEITVVQIVEEVLVVGRRLLLREEVRIRRVRSTERHQERVTLRYQDAVVTRLPVETLAPRHRPSAGGALPKPNQE